MSDRKLFQLVGDSVKEIEPRIARVELDIQRLLEQHLETLLGIRFLATKYYIAGDPSGEIDSLGIDENNCPVIIEYKRNRNPNVINQVLFYFHWLRNHKGDYALLVQNKYGSDVSKNIDWSGVRLMCVAADYGRYDSAAVKVISQAIELITYRYYGDNLLLLDYLTPLQPKSGAPHGGVDVVEPTEVDPSGDPASIAYRLERLKGKMRDVYETTSRTLAEMGDDVQVVQLKKYVAFKRIKNFACIDMPKSDRIIVYLRLDPTKVKIENGFTRDVRNKGHWGTGDLEVTLSDEADVSRAAPLFERAYAQG